MNTLLLRLSGALQSWGVQSDYTDRDTGLEPSKSGVLGLVCAAMGIDRENDDALAELAVLKMGVRIDRRGWVKTDYHTAGKGGFLRSDGSIERKDLIPSRRKYLSDALFLVGLESADLGLLERIHAALKDPVWPLFLGRKAFVPGEPVWLADGLKTGLGLEEALTTYRYLSERVAPERLRLVLEDLNGTIVRIDQPLSFASRRFAPRRLETKFVSTPSPVQEVV